MKIVIKCLLVFCMFIGTAVASETNQSSANASNHMLAQMSAKERHEHMKTMKENHPNIKRMTSKRAELQEERRAQAKKNIMDRPKKFN